MINRDKVIAVIQAEHNLVHGEFVDVSCENPGHCALGALLFAAGMANEELVGTTTPDDWSVDGREDSLMRRAYGLRRFHCEKIMSANDDNEHASIEDRRAYVIERVRDLALRAAANPSSDELRCDEYDAPYEPVYDERWDYDDAD